VPFNAPFYARRGFAIIDPLTAPAVIRAQFEKEIPPGIRMHERALMMRKLPEFRESSMRLT
jgi:hypothetical protein